ncbi:hypothetical protein XavaCFBP5823_21210, partial [Xanthomonas axonopodis pv. vasculorum]
IAREWSLMMSEERNARSATPRTPTATRTPGSWMCAGGNVICLRDVLRRRREKQLSVGSGQGVAGSGQRGPTGRGRRRTRRG